MRFLRPAAYLLVALSASVVTFLTLLTVTLVTLGSYLDDYCVEKINVPDGVSGTLHPNEDFGARGERVPNVVYPNTVRCDFTDGQTFERTDYVPIVIDSTMVLLFLLALVLIWRFAIKKTRRHLAAVEVCDVHDERAAQAAQAAQAASTEPSTPSTSPQHKRQRASTDH